jgi:hypothetical protein
MNLLKLPIFYKLLINSSCKLPANIMRFSYKRFRILLQTLQFTKIQNIITNFFGTSFETNFLLASSKILMNIIQTSCKLLTNLVQTLDDF